MRRIIFRPSFDSALRMAVATLALGILWGAKSSSRSEFPIALWSQSIGDPVVIDDVWSGVLLASEAVAIPSSNTLQLELVLRNPYTGLVLRKLVPEGWNFSRRNPQRASCDDSRGLFRIVNHGRLILGLECPWLVVFDIETGALIRRELPRPNLLERTDSLEAVPYPPKPIALAIDSVRGRLAAAYNVGPAPSLFIYTVDLKSELRFWPLKRFVQDVSWSRDGKHLAILYSGLYDENRQFIGWGRKPTKPGTFNLEIIDVKTGTVVARAFTGDAQEGQVLFDPESNFLYAIAADRLSDSEPQDTGIRVVDWKTGKLVRVLRKPGLSLHGEFAMSADGRWIAANASTDLAHLPLVESDAFGNYSRIVALSSATGEMLLQKSRKTSMARDPALLFADESNILFEVLGPGRSHQQRIEQKDEVSAYCMDTTCVKDPH